MSGQDLNKLAELIAEELQKRQTICHLSEEEQQAVKDMIKTKKNAVKVFLWVVAALCIWILKDVYAYIISHFSFK